MKKKTRLDIKMPVLSARAIFLFGELEEITIPYGMTDFDGKSYGARTVYMHIIGSRFPHTCIIHCRTLAISNIAHEAVHCSMVIQDMMGCISSFENDEITAYMVGYICERAEKFLRNNGTKKNKKRK